MINASDNSCRKTGNTNFMFNNFFNSYCLWDNVEKYFRACWIPKTTNTHTQVVQYSLLSIQQWLHVRALKLTLPCTACLVNLRKVNCSIGYCSSAVWNTLLIPHRIRVTSHVQENAELIENEFFMLPKVWMKSFRLCSHGIFLQQRSTDLYPVRQSNNSTRYTFLHKRQTDLPMPLYSLRTGLPTLT
jgi:hypothetical protein